MLEFLYPHFQDIEWAIDRNGKFFVLQSRPITTIPEGSFTVFDNSNVVESWPRITLPLTFSLVQKAYNANFTKAAKNLGIKQNRLIRNGEIFANLVGYVEGRIYYNLSNWYKMFDMLPGAGRFITPHLDHMISVTEKSDEEHGGNPFPPGEILEFFRFFFMVVWQLATNKFAMKKYTQKFDKLYKNSRSTDFTKLSNHQLIDHYYWLFHSVYQIFYIPLINDFLLMIFISIPKSLLKSFGFKDHESLFNALMSGEGGVESALPVYSILEMAKTLDESPETKIKIEELAETGSSQQLWETLENPEFLTFKTQFEQHIDLYGDRNPEELKLESDSFRQDPLALVKIILRHSGTSLSTDNMRNQEIFLRNQAEGKVAQGLQGRFLRKRLLDLTLACTRTFLIGREKARLDRSRFAGISRSIFLAIGGNLKN